MSRLVIICTVCFFLIVNCNGRPANNFDIKDLLKLIEEKKHASTSSEESSGDDYPVALRTMDVLDLIQQNNLDQKFRLLQQNELLKKQASQTEDLVDSKQYPTPFVDHHNQIPSNVFNKHTDDDELSEIIKQQVLDYLLKSGDVSKKRKHSTPNRLLSPVTLKDDDERGEKDELDKYSKIFVILDASAIQKYGNKNDEESLISKILSLSSAMNKKSRPVKNKSQYYKGFRVNNDLPARRYRRESKESAFGGIKDVDEPVIKKRRPSKSGGSGGGYGGGGFGGGAGAGRTGIPFVKSRGDIYERAGHHDA